METGIAGFIGGILGIPFGNPHLVLLVVAQLLGCICTSSPAGVRLFCFVSKGKTEKNSTAVASLHDGFPR